MIRIWAVVFFLFGAYSAYGNDRGPIDLSCQGPLVQGGFVICFLPLGHGVYQLDLSNGTMVTVSSKQPTLIPFARNSPLDITISAKGRSRHWQASVNPVQLHLQRGNWAIERIDGLPPGKVTPRTLAAQKKIAADWKKKQSAWGHRAAAHWYAGGFTAPVQNARISGEYGSQRILNGTPKNPHLGMDFAIATGTDVLAPANAIVVLAEPDMYFEGGLLVLDHGDGVVSVMMHLSRLDVGVGEQIAQGDVIGAVGMTGRATGPHLHWGIKVRGTYINPALALTYRSLPEVAPGP